MRLSGTVYSKTLGIDTGLTVVTPNKLRDGYKAVYLLHGMSGNSRTWLDYSLLPIYANSGNSVYIMPEAGRSFYTDMKLGFKYFTYITEELPHICENIFNIFSERENTAIVGGSMGGYGALRCAFLKPERYGMCAAFSSGCLALKDWLAEARERGVARNLKDNFGEQIEADFYCAFGSDLEYRPENDIFELIRRAKNSPLRPKLYLTCGTRDCFYDDHAALCAELERLGIAFEFDTWDAKHDFLYFNEALRRTIEKFEL